ncbi:MAG: AraC family transcriptional regulator [Maribacter sp.]|nr:AraC family transcriptional regulator [Maribacter sp.]
MKKREGFKGEKSVVLPDSIIDTLHKNPLTRLLYVTDIGYYPNAKFHFRKRTKGIGQNILIYCVDGEGMVEIEKQRFQLKQNQYIIIPKNVAHNYSSSTTNPWTIYWLHFAGERASLFINPTVKYYEIGSEIQGRFTDRIFLFDEIYQNLTTGYSYENLEYASTCLWHMLGSLKYFLQFKSNKEYNSDGSISKSIEYIKNNLNKQMTVGELARYSGFSESHFSLLFKKKTGQSPLNFAVYLKIQKGCHLIEFSDMKIRDIAAQLGYEDSFYFSRVFSKVMGMSPAKFKKMRLAVS